MWFSEDYTPQYSDFIVRIAEEYFLDPVWLRIGINCYKLAGKYYEIEKYYKKMKRIDFTKSDGFLLEQDTLGFMQKGYDEGIGSPMGLHLSGQREKNYIPSGLENNEQDNYCYVWVIITGELLRFQKGDGVGKMEVLESTKLAFLKTVHVHRVYLKKFAGITQGEGLRIQDFIRIKKPLVNSIRLL